MKRNRLRNTREITQEKNNVILKITPSLRPEFDLQIVEKNNK